jgi:hypothetical protein
VENKESWLTRIVLYDWKHPDAYRDKEGIILSVVIKPLGRSGYRLYGEVNWKAELRIAEGAARIIRERWQPELERKPRPRDMHCSVGEVLLVDIAKDGLDEWKAFLHGLFNRPESFHRWGTQQ